MKKQEIAAMIEDLGGKVLDLTVSKHWKARIERPDGTEFVLGFPVADTDGRAIKNKKAQLKKLMKSNE